MTSSIKAKLEPVWFQAHRACLLLRCALHEEELEENADFSIVFGKTRLVLRAENVELVVMHPYSLYNKWSRRQLSQAMKSKSWRN